MTPRRPRTCWSQVEGIVQTLMDRETLDEREGREVPGRFVARSPLVLGGPRAHGPPTPSGIILFPLSVQPCARRQKISRLAYVPGLLCALQFSPRGRALLLRPHQGEAPGLFVSAFVLCTE
jgi:hypothetical protein